MANVRSFDASIQALATHRVCLWWSVSAVDASVAELLHSQTPIKTRGRVVVVHVLIGRGRSRLAEIHDDVGPLRRSDVHEATTANSEDSQ